MKMPLRKESILIVDDEPQVLAALSDVLEEDFNVFTLDSPESAMELLSQHEEEMSVIISDQRMPNTKGHEFLSRAKEVSDATRLLITGFSDLEAVVSAVNDGKIFGYISKPWDTEALKMVIYKAIEHHHLIKKLREREERFQQLADNIHDVFWMMSLDGSDLYISPAYEKIWGRPIKETIENPEIWSESIYSEDRDKASMMLGQDLEILTSYDQEFRIVRPDGAIRWIHDQAFPVRNHAGKAYRIAGVSRDITERKENEQKIARLNRVHALLSGINSAIVRIKDRKTLFDEVCNLANEKGEYLLAWVGLYQAEDNTVKVISHAGSKHESYLIHDQFSTREHMSGYCRLIEELLESKEPVICNDIYHDPRMTAWKEQAMKNGFRSNVVLPIEVNNEIYGMFGLYCADTGAFTSDEMKLLSELSGDISYALQNIEHQEQLDYLAYFDSITGLSNRALFIERLTYMLDTADVLTSSSSSSKHLAVLVFDIKQFRHINNAFGKQIGDDVLKEVAIRLREVIKEGSNIARISNDYFAMILPKKEGNASSIASWFKEELVPLITKPMHVDQHEIRLDITGGVAVYPADGLDADTLYHNAEAALKKAKVSNEQYLFYQTGMMEKIVASMVLQNRMRVAVDEEQFVLHYQPKIDAATHKVSAVEALIRWNDPENGLVPPGKFIPILEDTNLILNVGAWAISQALKDIMQWQAQGMAPVRVAVNVSPLQLQQENFVDVVSGLIKACSGTELMLDIEVTESLLMKDFENNIKKLRAIKDLGMKIFIDDFGTGYSSLSYLTKLPINAMKIDRSFISTMVDVPESMTIVSSIISLSQSLNLKVVAEGVETEEQAKLLKLLRCDELQGFLFSKPLPAADLPAFIKKFHR